MVKNHIPRQLFIAQHSFFAINLVSEFIDTFYKSRSECANGVADKHADRREGGIWRARTHARTPTPTRTMCTQNVFMQGCAAVWVDDFWVAGPVLRAGMGLHRQVNERGCVFFVCVIFLFFLSVCVRRIPVRNCARFLGNGKMNFRRFGVCLCMIFLI